MRNVACLFVHVFCFFCVFLCVLLVCVGVCVWLNAHCCMVRFSVCSVCVYAGASVDKCALLHGLFFLFWVFCLRVCR